MFYARGYKSGGANSSSLDHPQFQHETVNDYEAGWKGRLLEGHMLTQVGFYYYNYQNMQYSLYDTEAQNDTSTGTYVANLAASTIYGVEVSEQSRFGGLGVNLGFDYGHTALGAVTTLNNGALPAGWGSPTALPQCLPGHTYGAITCFDYTPYLQNVSGEQNPFAPLITANLTVDYLFHVSANGTLDPRVTFSHTDKQYASIFENPFYEMAARNLLNASIDWVVGHWDTQVWGTNLSNQIYEIAGGNNVYYGPPRQAGIQATYRF